MKHVFKLEGHHTVPCDFIKRRYTTHLHGVFKLSTDFVYVCTYTIGLTAVYSRYKRSCDKNSVCTQCKGFKDVCAASDATIYKNLNALAFKCLYDAFKNLSSGRTLIQHTSTVI